MSKLTLLGDEAVGLGAVHAGISAAYGYPGTPSTEIIEYIQALNQDRPLAVWCTNEKTAYEEALGVSYAGRRALVTMKHVGLNVAADPFVNSALLNIRGGLVLLAADDPGMHSSQNEQDSRFYADFAKVLCLEPCNQQEAYEMTREAFDLSERFGIPVMVRITTRLAHSRAGVEADLPRQENPLVQQIDSTGWGLLPAFARKQYTALLEKQKDIQAYTNTCPHNKLRSTEDSSPFGVITAGLGRNYFLENIEDLGWNPPHLHIGAYPLPVEKIRSLASTVSRILVIEEGMPFIEDALLGVLPTGIRISGKLDGSLPSAGELNPDLVRKALGLSPRPGVNGERSISLPPRPPQLCAGCPHGDTYTALKKILAYFPDSVITSDIGCYALGALPPYAIPETIVCMGASIGMAIGAAEAGKRPAVAVIGDSTFLHSGITPLIDAVARKVPITVVILDNSTVAMTGGQDTILPSSHLPSLIRGLGVEPEHVVSIEAHRKYETENVETLRREIEYPGVSVVIAVRECLEYVRSRKSQKGAEA
ncbi:MAG TPA: thiamine pyrophosphate-dependent enzyme [Spirochaetales bacterium]|nr:thiamine pyrophosphate-dependent enzyme [Spirochaetales bacterium]